MSDVTALGDGRFLLTDNGRRTLAHAVSTADATWIFVNGRVYVLPERAAGAPRPRADDQAALAAPMPATVASIAVAPGQTVTAGETLIVLEAMKMELAIKAPRDGRVSRVACIAGELVQPGVPLVDLE